MQRYIALTATFLDYAFARMAKSAPDASVKTDTTAKANTGRSGGIHSHGSVSHVT